MNRRQFLLAGLTGGVGLLAGCSSVAGPNRTSKPKPQLEVFVVNAREETIEVTITATRGSTEFFTHTYTLAPGEGDESKSFVGTPTEIRVSIQNGRTITRGYSIPASCDSPDVNVTIEPDAIRVTNGCVST